MTSFSVTSFKKAISDFQEDSAKFPTQQKLDLLFLSGWSSEVSGCPLVSKILTAQRASVRTSVQHRPDTLQCLRRIQIFFGDTNWERQLATVWTLGQYCMDSP
jgi:hypothetical protein